VDFELDANTIKISPHARNKFVFLSKLLFGTRFEWDDDASREIRELLSRAELAKVNQKDQERMSRHDERMRTFSAYYVCAGWRFVIDVLGNSVITIERENPRENDLHKEHGVVVKPGKRAR